ncbi:NUMOD1 domain-containing DNA-binding protein, partial [Bacillus sp. MHSD17]|nr:NUMOD1 domain-containing DNA-binding protein [Bacillus sp. MHSD17]
PLKDQVESFEESIIREAIKIYPSIRKAATALKIDQSTLVRKLQKYKIENHS